MCRRFVQKYSWSELADAYALSDTPRTLNASYNIAPTATIDVVCLQEGLRKLVPMRWGLKAARQTRISVTTRIKFTIRAETLGNRSIFTPHVTYSPCIIPASGYYAWSVINGGKQAFYVSAADGGPLAIAGLADMYTPPESRGPPTRSCALIVAAGNDVVAEVHQHRMPVFLQPKNFASWLDGSARGGLLTPAPNELLRLWRVSRRINETAAKDDASLIEPVAAGCL